MLRLLFVSVAPCTTTWASASPSGASFQPFSVRACVISSMTRFSPIWLPHYVPSLMLNVLIAAKFAALS